MGPTWAQPRFEWPTFFQAFASASAAAKSGVEAAIGLYYGYICFFWGMSMEWRKNGNMRLVYYGLLTFNGTMDCSFRRIEIHRLRWSLEEYFFLLRIEWGWHRTCFFFFAYHIPFFKFSHDDSTINFGLGSWVKPTTKGWRSWPVMSWDPRMLEKCPLWNGDEKGTRKSHSPTIDVLRYFNPSEQNIHGIYIYIIYIYRILINRCFYYRLSINPSWKLDLWTSKNTTSLGRPACGTALVEMISPLKNGAEFLWWNSGVG